MGSSKTNLSQKQKLSLTQKRVIAISSSAFLILIFFISIKLFNSKVAKTAINCGNDVTSSVTITDTTTCSSDFTIDGGTLIIESALTLSCKVSFDNGGTVVIKNGGTLTVDEIEMKSDNNDEISVEAGGWLYFDKATIQKGSFSNYGYVEHTGTQKFNLKKVNVTGDGVLYIADKSQVKLTGNGQLHGTKSNALADDKFILGSKELKVKRLPKFKVQEDDIELGDELVITDTLDLNGKSLDAKSHKFKLPKSFSFHRNGGNSEYIKTNGTGRYALTIIQNDLEHIAPIGRNPYLPLAAECEDCESTEFAVSVTQNVYQDPVQQSGIQSQNAIGETWSVIPDRDVTGTVTFEMQWNAGANGTTSSELSGFNRNGATSFYWIVGESSQWLTDGNNVGVAVTGSDPYTIQITLEDMTEGTEYLFSVGSAGTALPVEFSYFNADALAEKIDLQWGTATETNNDYFEVQRSTDGVLWETINQVNGAGTTLDEQNYQVYDNSPIEGLVYYRIKQTDFNGEYDFSEVRQVSSSVANEIELQVSSVFPNPFSNQLSIVFEIVNDGDVQLQLVNSKGATLQNVEQKFMAGKNTYTFSDLGALKPGTYIVRCIINGESITKTIIKQ